MVAGSHVSIGHTGDVARACDAMRTLGRACGFGASDLEELVLVARELATNLVRHAGGGQLTLMPVENDGRSGVRIESLDRGPGIVHIDEAITDGYSSAGSLGYGLGTVNRLMDQMDIVSPAGDGKGVKVVAERLVRNVVATGQGSPLEIGVACRPCPGHKVSGDAYVVKRWGAWLLVAVIDGLGHGVQAHRAGQKAREYVERHYDVPMDALFRGTARNCRGTRGVVMAAMRINWESRTIEHCSIGNVETQLLGERLRPGLISRRGILGGQYPTVRVTQHDWRPGMTFLMYTDGVTGRRDEERMARDSGLSPQALARQILRYEGRLNDDATVVVIGSAQ